MTRILAVAVPKGGTGKTTTTINLGAARAARGQRVLLVDFDPQGNLTQSLGLRPSEVPETAYTAIKHYISAPQQVLRQGAAGDGCAWHTEGCRSSCAEYPGWAVRC
jgi:cellulose biosynthesis protein BcsQ